MHHGDRKIVRLSIVVLVLCILVVYALFYQVKWNNLVNNLNTDQEKDEIVKIYVKDGDKKEQISALNIQDKSLINKNNTGNLNDNEVKINYLSGTQLYYGILESVEKLGISYKYILKDSKNIYYVFLGDNKYDLVDITRKLGGNIYAMNTEQEILKNQLFGEKIAFINIPEYKNKLVLMLVNIDNQNWLLQLNYDIYHKSKSYLKSLFID
ncbi:hypothetical protein K9M48_00950 [Candidatus Gracilibacteria bacterium]|nr:hypothetical protein [Candidatus Gracilibacteria bacterium]